jgi:hypothetical protein
VVEVLFFLAWWNSCFCRGFCKKRGAERGFLMVKSWWNAGKRWSENDLKLALKNMPLFLDLFSEFSRFGKVRATLDASHFRG